MCGDVRQVARSDMPITSVPHITDVAAGWRGAPNEFDLVRAAEQAVAVDDATGRVHRVLAVGARGRGMMQRNFAVYVAVAGGSASGPVRA